MTSLVRTIGFPIVAALGAAALGVPATPAAAQPGGIVFVDLGRWTIYEYTSAGFCEMRLKAGLNGDLVLSKRAGSPGSLRLSLNNANRFPGADITFAFDEVQFAGMMRDGRSFGPSSDSTAIEAEFRKAETLSVLQGGATIASISLKSSSAGFRLLDQCAKQWREGFFPPRPFRQATTPAPISRPAPQQSRPQPQTTARRGPYPANRAVSPRNTSSWIREGDFRTLPNLRGDGVLTFSLLINPQGEVEECSVLKSSGSRQLDGQTCRLLQSRAQFDPATDANGFAKEATYTSQVEFAVAE